MTLCHYQMLASLSSDWTFGQPEIQLIVEPISRIMQNSANQLSWAYLQPKVIVSIVQYLFIRDISYGGRSNRKEKNTQFIDPTSKA